MSEPLNVLGIAGSLRKASVNRGLLRAAVAEAPPSVRLSVFDLATIPLYDADVEAEGDPAPVADLKRQILAADALLLATPEYNRGMTGVMKNALDWASRPPERALAGKPVAIMGATPGGFGTRASQFQTKQILGNPGAFVLPKPEVWVSSAGKKFDEHGELTDQATRETLVDLLLALEEFAGKVL